MVAVTAAVVVGIVERNGFGPIADDGLTGEDAQLAWLEGDGFVGGGGGVLREVESERVFGVAIGRLTFEEICDVGLVTARGIVETASGNVGVLFDLEFPTRQVGERDGGRVGLAAPGRDAWSPGHPHVIGVMDNDDRGDVEADINPGEVPPPAALGPLDERPLVVCHLVDREGEGDALDVGRCRNVQRAGDESAGISVE